MRNEKVKRTALVGMLFALAMVLSFLEGSLAPLLGLPPGVKPGLANIVVMYAILCLGKKEATLLVVLKAGFAMLTRGFSAGVLSLTGGLLSLLVMLLLCSLKERPTLFILSVSGALCHNFGQLLALQVLFTQNVYTLYYTPVLLISGLIMGTVTSISLRAVMPALEKLGVKHY